MNDVDVDLGSTQRRRQQVHFSSDFEEKVEGEDEAESSTSSSTFDSDANPSSISGSGSNSTSPESNPTYCPGNFIPASRRGWNGRYLHTGNGGQRGMPEYDEMKQSLIRMRIAVSGSNVGHFGSGGQTTWSIGNVEEQIDFGYRGIRVSGIASQLVTSVFYGTVPSQETAKDEDGEGEISSTPSSTASSSTASSTSTVRKRTDNGSYYPLGFPSYFAGCSTGGREAFSLVQKSPELFNGIIAGSPVWDYNHLNAFQIHVNSLLANSSSPTFIPRSKYPLIHKAVLQACDEIDGVQDQVIERPDQCKVDFKKRLLCGGGDDETNFEGSLTSTTDCLTEDQIGNLDEVFKPYTIGDELVSFTGSL